MTTGLRNRVKRLSRDREKRRGRRRKSGSIKKRLSRRIGEQMCEDESVLDMYPRKSATLKKGQTMNLRHRLRRNEYLR